MTIIRYNTQEGKEKLQSLNFVLSYYAVHNPEMMAAIIYAKARLGKSVYALQVGYDIYRDWDKVLGHTKFLLEDVLGLILDAVDNEYVIPYMVWDDAGVYGNKYLFFTQRKLTMMLQGLFDVVGTAVKCFILTTPNPGNLLKAIREYEFYRIKISKQNDRDGRVATGYANILLPSGTINIRKEFMDTYRVRIPDDVYKRYFDTRKAYAKQAASTLKNYLDTMKNDPDNFDTTVQQQADEAYEEVKKTQEYIQDKIKSKKRR